MFRSDSEYYQQYEQEEVERERQEEQAEQAAKKARRKRKPKPSEPHSEDKVSLEEAKGQWFQNLQNMTGWTCPANFTKSGQIGQMLLDILSSGRVKSLIFAGPTSLLVRKSGGAQKLFTTTG